MAKKETKPLEVKTPYPKKDDKPAKDIKYLGDALVNLSDRINKQESLIETLAKRVKLLAGRMGL